MIETEENWEDMRSSRRSGGFFRLKSVKTPRIFSEISAEFNFIQIFLEKSWIYL